MPEWRSEMSLSIQRLCFYLQEQGDKEPELSKLLCEDGVLLLTDSADFYRRARCVDIACVCYQKASGYIEGVEYVIEDAAQLDMEWLNRCYQRQKGIPWVIAKTERCIIREMTTADIDRLYIMYEKEGIGRYVRGLPGTYADSGLHAGLYYEYVPLLRLWYVACAAPGGRGRDGGGRTCEQRLAAGGRAGAGICAAGAIPPPGLRAGMCARSHRVCRKKQSVQPHRGLHTERK